MTYDYTCRCGARVSLVCAVADRDEQTCPLCVASLDRVQIPTKLCIVIPAAFQAATAQHNLAQPQSAEERATWDREGVRAFKDSDF